MEDLRSREEQQRLFEEYVERKKISDENKRVVAERLAKEIADKVGTEEEVRPGTVASNKSEPVAEEEEKADTSMRILVAESPAKRAKRTVKCLAYGCGGDHPTRLHQQITGLNK